MSSHTPSWLGNLQIEGTCSFSYLEPWGMGKPHRSSWLTTAQGKEGTDVGEGFRVTPIFLQSCPIFPGREGEHTWPRAVVTETSAAKNRPVYWRASFPDGQLSWEQLKKSNLHSGFQKYLVKMWCDVYSHRRLLSLTEEADQRQKQKLGWRHWFGQFTVHLTRKILPYLTPSLSASPAWTDSNPAISFESSAFCPPFLPISLIRSLTCSFHNVAFRPLPLLTPLLWTLCLAWETPEGFPCFLMLLSVLLTYRHDIYLFSLLFQKSSMAPYHFQDENSTFYFWRLRPYTI